MVPISDRRGRESPASVKPVNTTATPKSLKIAHRFWGITTDYVVYTIETGMGERFEWVSGRQPVLFLTIRRGWLCRRLVLLRLRAAALRS